MLLLDPGMPLLEGLTLSLLQSLSESNVLTRTMSAPPCQSTRLGLLFVLIWPTTTLLAEF